jgi:hypothetical protein
MKKRTKALIGILTATSLTVAAVSMMFIHNPEADAKNASFNGIENLIKSSTEENPFTVVELVPDERMAKFGYFVEGSEPEDWKKEIALLDTKKKRMDYMAGLKNKLATISASDNTKPLTYNEYKEAYSLDAVNPADEAKYSSFNLAKPLVIKKGVVSGYKMVDEAGGSFAFDASFVEQAGGDYDENVVSYEYSQNIDGKYAVKFKKADLSNPDGSIVYRASEVREFHNADEVKVLGFTRYIYRKAKGATGSNVVYEYALSNKDADGYSFDFTNYDYVLLSFEGVDVSTLTAAERTSRVYYLVESAEYLGSEAEYDGVLNSVERYKKVASGRGHFAVASEDSYVFVGKGKGSKKLVEVAGGKLDHDLVIDRVFYTGGFKNNNWFENGVFLKNFSDNKYLPTTNPDYNGDKMKIKVVTLTPAGIDAALVANPNYFSNVGLLYIVGSNSLVSGIEPNVYKEGNDIDPNTFEIIKNEANLNNLPVLIDNKTDAYTGSTNMLELAKELISNRKSVDSVNYDGHFVNKNVYSLDYDKGNTPFIFEGFASDFINEKTSDSAFVNKAKDVGFGEVAESIVEENDFVDKGVEGTTDNTKKFTLEISKARALEYIISYKMRRQRTTDDVVKILDIEPAKVVGQKDVDSQRMKDKVKNWFEPNGKSIKHTSETVPTYELIGRNEDLSDYDLIYMGLDTSSFNMTDKIPQEVEIGEVVLNPVHIPERWVDDIHKLPITTRVTLSADVRTDPNTGIEYIANTYPEQEYTEPAATIQQKINGKPQYKIPGYNMPRRRIIKTKAIRYVDSLETSYHTVYNDTKMNGLIYSNVGDIYKAFNGYADVLYRGGLLDTDYLDPNGKVNGKQPGANGKYNNIEAYKDEDPDSDGIKYNFKRGLSESDYHNGDTYIDKARSDDIEYRFAGNDITEEKLNRLKEYIKSGYPIVFADGFVKTSGSSLIVNDYLIDNSSRMYELVDFAIKWRDNPSNKQKNVIFEKADEKLNANDLNSLITNINLPKPEIKLEERNLEKDIDIPGRTTDYSRINNRTLEINFKLLNKGFENDKVKFKLSLYVDSNSDGKFSGTREIINPRYYTVLKDNAIHKGKLTSSKTSWYKITYKLPQYYVGIVPWKIKIESVDGNGLNRYTSATGFGYVQNAGAAKKINILQIKSSDNVQSHFNENYKGDYTRYKYNNLFYYNYRDTAGNLLTFKDPSIRYNNWIGEGTFDMADNALFKELLDEVKNTGDFDITIKSVSPETLIYWYNDWRMKNPDKRPVEYFDATATKYDMIVMGFGDSYTLPNVNNCLEPIQDWANSGKPILYTHDCTSQVNYRGTSSWNYDLNRMIRGLVGLDRYGVLNNWPLRVGTGADKNNAVTKFEKTKYPTIAANTSDNFVTSSRLFEIAKENAERNNKDIKDIAYEPRSNKTKIVKEVQGFTNGSLVYLSGNESTNAQFKFAKGYVRSERHTNRVEQINKGQITTYPFKIEKELEVAKTHYQPYQIDFNEDDDEDGESDLIVWYTLASRESMKNNPASEYNLAPRDVRNNYYIYTKGNITYSGVGHEKVTGREEMKLYVNTLIAAYKAAMVPPSIEFKETGDPDAAEKTVSYISYDVSSDANNNGVVTGDKEKVYFTPVDYNSFVKDTNPLQTKVLVKPVNTKGGLYNVYRADGTKELTESDDQIGECYALMPGESYYFEVPLSELGGNKNKIDIKVSARTRVTRIFRGSSVTLPKYSPESVSTYIIQKRGLFDLD